MTLIDIKSAADFKNQITKKPFTVVHFWAEWCVPCTDIDKFLSQLETQLNNENLQILRVEAEQVSDVTEQYKVESVPAFVLFSQNGAIQFAKIEGANPALVAKQIQQMLASSSKLDLQTAAQKPSIDFSSLVNRSPIMLFMKGTPTAPRCGFSSKMVQLLNEQKIKFDYFDVLTDNEVREGLKKFSNWPTYPQLYSKGKLIGGLDIVKELIEDGSLLEELGIEPINQLPLEEKLKQLINRSPVMLFMKGTPSTPKCGFSAKIVQLLQDEGVTFDYFDILTDNDVREGLKKYSNWPTYPQLYSKGQLIGGLDIVKELIESGELKESLE
jgi:Grx4 family monothiol glutaredoxin